MSAYLHTQTPTMVNGGQSAAKCGENINSLHDSLQHRQKEKCLTKRTRTQTHTRKRESSAKKSKRNFKFPKKAELKSPKNEHGRVIMCIIISGINININIDNTTTTHQRNTRTTTTTPLYYYYYNTGRLTSALMLKAPRLR